MQTLLTLIAALALATTAHARKTVTSLLFDPPQQSGIIFWQDGAFSGQTSVSFAEMSEQGQVATGAALAWLATQMPEGTTGIIRVTLWRVAEDGLDYRFDSEALATNGSAGATVRASSVDGTDEAGINALWFALEATINGELIATTGENNE
jgi:hypothetical protein